MINDEDFDVITVEPLGGKPAQLYFFPVITFIVFLYFNRVGILLPNGYISALLGVSVVSIIVITAFVGFGIITNEYYTIRTRAQSVVGEVLIGMLSLFSTQVTFFVLGWYVEWFPTVDIVLWFIYGFLVYQVMWQIFKLFYERDPFGDNRVNVFTGMVLTILAGIVPIYFAISFGWLVVA